MPDPQSVQSARLPPYIVAVASAAQPPDPDRQGRYALDCVRLEVGDGCARVTATNGRVLLSATTQNQEGPHWAVSLPARELAKAVKACRTPRRPSAPVYITRDPDAHACTVHGAGASVVILEILDRPYPKFDAVIPVRIDATEPGMVRTSLHLDPTLLAMVVQSARGAAGKPTMGAAHAVRLQVPAETGAPIRIDAKGDAVTVVGAVMPIAEPV